MLEDDNIDILISNLKKEFNINKQFKSIYFNIQNEKIIIRNIKGIKSKKEKDILGLIKYEINQYMPIDFDNYSIKYKKIINENKDELIQVILLPISIINICKIISKELNITKKYLNINFDILDKLIRNNRFKDLDDDKILVIENRVDNMVVNTIYKKQVIESYIININNNTQSYLENLNKNNKVLFYGLRNEIITESNIKELSIDDKLNIYPIKENNINNLEYISTLGMLI